MLPAAARPIPELGARWAWREKRLAALFGTPMPQLHYSQRRLRHPIGRGLGRRLPARECLWEKEASAFVTWCFRIKRPKHDHVKNCVAAHNIGRMNRSFPDYLDISIIAYILRVATEQTRIEPLVYSTAAAVSQSTSRRRLGCQLHRQ